METQAESPFRFPRPMTWLLVLVTMLMLLVMVQASEDADAETWSSDYAVRTDSENWQRLDVDGDSAYVVYIRGAIGSYASFLRFHNGTAWSTELSWVRTCRC